MKTLDGFLKELMSSKELIDRKLIMVMGDFRQFHPVILRGRREKIVNKSIKKSEF